MARRGSTGNGPSQGARTTIALNWAVLPPTGFPKSNRFEVVEGQKGDATAQDFHRHRERNVAIQGNVGVRRSLDRRVALQAPRDDGVTRRYRIRRPR